MSFKQMRIVVCVRQGIDGEISPFDACAYEAALRQNNAEIILLSMGPESVKDFLIKLTRLGAAKAVLLCDKAFAGADTLATAYALSRAIEKLTPDMVFCGRQTLVGDTGQVGPMLAEMLSFRLVTNVMSLQINEEHAIFETRSAGRQEANFPVLITVERINKLRLPGLRSKVKECEMWSAEDISADTELCGLRGSPTRVLKTFENGEGKRKCRFISRDMLGEIIEAARKNESGRLCEDNPSREKLTGVISVGEAALEYAESICDDVRVIRLDTAEKIAEEILRSRPSAVIWGSDDISKAVAARVAAKLNLGLCADCTRLEAEGGKMIMYRPALAGSIVARIESLTTPAMATVRTTEAENCNILVAAGYGVKNNLEAVKSFADKIGGRLVTTRKMVDNDFMPYEAQVGLTGKTVAPAVYIAVGVSGAVHHIAGMQKSGTVIAINPDKNAPIFDYADFGILEEFH